MALKDLILTEASLPEGAIEAIVSDYVRFDVHREIVVFNERSKSLSNKSKTLIYLVALQGWGFLGASPLAVDAKPAEIAEHAGIRGNSLRPILLELKNDNLVIERAGRYSVAASALEAIQRQLRNAGPARLGSSERARHSSYVRQQAIKSNTKTRSAMDAFRSFIDQGFFDQPRTLSDVRGKFEKEAVFLPRTSIPNYLLIGVQSGRLVREKISLKGRRIWIYARSEAPLTL
jgi:hypothetical protein